MTHFVVATFRPVAALQAPLEQKELSFANLDLAAAKAQHKAKQVEAKKSSAKRPKLSLVKLTCDGLSVSVPYELLQLSNGDKILRYKADNAPSITERPDVRAPFLSQNPERLTQLQLARKGIITPEMEYVALRESANALEFLADESYHLGKFKSSQGVDFSGVLNGTSDEIKLEREFLTVSPEMVREEIAAGRAVIPANFNHLGCEPMIIGKRFLTKVNANIGTSAVSSGFSEELTKLKQSLKFGADTVMDLSTGISVNELAALRRAIVKASPVPIGTVPIYEALDRAGGDANALNWELFKQVIIEQAQQGVDYFTIHAGLTKSLLEPAAKRLLGIVSRGGAIMASHMLQHECENMAYEHFEELMDICARYDVALSLGDGLRPGSIYDAGDAAQYGELKNIGELAKRCYERGVQCFIEGPGHVPLHKVQENQELEEQYCHAAPFYTLGPLVSDIGAGFDHITSAIGGTTIAMHGTAMLCYVTPAEHLALPDSEDVRVGLISYKLAAHAADLAKGITQAYNLDHAMSRARADFRWFDQFALSFDSEHAYKVWRSQMDDEDCLHEVSYCSMCGPRFCPIRLNRRLQAKFTK